MKNYYLGVYASLLVLFSFLFYAQNIFVAQSAVDNKKQDLSFPSASQFANSKFTYKFIQAANKTLNYATLADCKMMIDQPLEPGFSGDEGFYTNVNAQKVEELVIRKIKNGEMPPSVTKEEMQKIGSF